MVAEPEEGHEFRWASRLRVAATVANALSFMHDKLQREGIAHGNLKSSNIFLTRSMDAVVSEYGLLATDDRSHPSPSNPVSRSGHSAAASAMNTDVYCFGIVLLELLTGKPVQNSGMKLAKWVNSVLREEWTVEVFDRALIAEGAVEEQLVNLLQAAIKCVNIEPDRRPTMAQVADTIAAIQAAEESKSSSLSPEFEVI